MGGATALTGPHAITQGYVLVGVATHRTQFRRRKPRVDMIDHRAKLRGDMMQGLHEAAKAQIRDFAAPQGFHSLKIERFQGDVVVLLAQIAGQLPLKGLAHRGDTTMHSRQMLGGFPPVLRAFHLARQGSVRLANAPQLLFERLGRLVFRPIVASQIRRQPKVEACAFTRHDSVDGLRINDTGKIYGQLANPIAFDRHRFDRPFDLPRLSKLVDGGTDTQAVATQQLPASLRQRERFGLGNLPQGGRSNFLRGFPGFAVLQVLEEALIAFVNTVNDLLDRLRAKLLPPGICGKLLQLGDMGLELKEGHMLLVQTIVPATERNRMIVDCTTDIDQAVQFPVTLAAIELVHEGASHAEMVVV